MDRFHHHQQLPRDLLDDVVHQLCLDNYLRKRTRHNHGPNKEYFFYSSKISLFFCFVCRLLNVFLLFSLDGKNEIFWNSSDLAVVRNLLEPSHLVARELLKMCRFLGVKQLAISSYAIELFDNFFTHLLAAITQQRPNLLASFGIKKGLDVSIGYGLSYLVTTAAQPLNNGDRFHFLYDQLTSNTHFVSDSIMPNDYHASLRGGHIRLICLSMCLFLAAKIENKARLPRLEAIANMLRNHYHLPAHLTHPASLATFELRVLAVMQFNLNLTTLHVHEQVLLGLLCDRLRFLGCSPAVVARFGSRVETLVGLFLENIYMMQVTIVSLVFQLHTGVKFNCTDLEHIDMYEELIRNKMVMAAGLMVAICSLSGDVPTAQGSVALGPSNRDWVGNFFAEHVQLELFMVNNFSRVILFYIPGPCVRRTVRSCSRQQDCSNNRNGRYLMPTIPADTSSSHPQCFGPW